MSDKPDTSRDELSVLIEWLHASGEPKRAALVEALLAERDVVAKVDYAAGMERGFTAGAKAMREAAAALHESINPASDQERLRGDPGAGAMGAVIEYRDAIRALPLPERRP